MPPGRGNGALETGEECDDGNTANADGCSSACLCNLANTPAVCDLSGDWTVVEFGDTITIVEDTEGNHSSAGSVAGNAYTAQGTRSGSCLTGTATVEPFGPFIYRATVNNACDTQIVGGGDQITLVRAPSP